MSAALAIPRIEPRSTAGLVPPNDLDAEAAVLSSVLLSKPALDEVTGKLLPEHFYSDANGSIFEAATQLAAAGTPVDLVTVVSYLRDRDRLSKVGGMAYVAQVADSTPAIGNVSAHAEIVAEKWRMRQLIATCQQVAAEGYGDVGEVREWMDGAEVRISSAVRTSDAAEASTLRDALVSATRDLEEAERFGGFIGLSTGFGDMDRMLGGLREGGMTVVGARASMGKTALANAIGLHVSRNHGGLLIFSMEMRKEELAQRWAMCEGEIDVYKLRELGKLSPEDWQRFSGATNALAKLPILIDDTTDLSIAAMRSKARRVAAWFNRRGSVLSMVIVDYIQMMNGRAGLNRGSTREQEVSAISRACKVMAGELGCHVIAVAQLNRALESRTVKDKRPRMSDLRESGSIEQDANNVILLYRDEYYDPNSGDKGIAEVIIEKQRSGMRGVTVPIAFDASLVRFRGLTVDDRNAWYDRRKK